jgi:uncharacterized protein (TIGR00266 family)
MKPAIVGSPSLSHLHVDLSPGETVIAENAAMRSMSSALEIKGAMNGGFLSALAKKLFGRESFFVNHLSNTGSDVQRVTLAQDVPGGIVEHRLDGRQALCLQKGAFLARTEGVRLKTSWAGFASLIGGEGLVRLKASGEGVLWYGAYGGIVARQVDGELKVDDGHLVAYDPAVKLKPALAGGLFSSLFGGEGLVIRLVGRGTVYIQTRSLKGLAGWLNPKFR